jgi:hypothetical protein
VKPYHSVEMRRSSLGALAVIAMTLVSACGGGDDAGPRTTKTPQTQSTPADTPLPEASSPASTEAGAATPEAAARGLYDAWLADDPDAAAATATQQAIDQLFAHPGNEIDFTGCEPTGATYTCFFYYEGGGLDMIVEGSAASGYLVTRAFFVAD